MFKRSREYKSIMNMPEELIKQAFDEEFEEQLLAIRQSCLITVVH